MIALREMARTISAAGWAVIAACLLALLLLATCAQRGASDARRDARDAEVRAKQIELARKADGAAAEQRRIDEIIIHQREKALTDAVKDIPDARPGPRRLALACQRLRNQGIADPNLPAECRPDS